MTVPARPVVSGTESGDFVEILSGLSPGETVVTSGQFLIDSEASLKASLQRMRASSESEEAPAPVLGGTGVVRRLYPGEDRLNMEHDPIEALGWPSMVMDFRVEPGVSLEGLAPGDAVEFELREGSDGYRVSAIRRRADGEGGR